MLTVGNEETACSSQNDAGMGGDADSTNGYDLGQMTDIEYRGCLDANDETDKYTITLQNGEILNLTIVNAPGGSLTVDLNGPNGDSLDTSWFGDHELTTEGSDDEGVAGTYTIIVNRSFFGAGAGTYRMIIGEPTEYVAPFTCIGYSDVGTGTDAGTGQSNPIVMGNNPAIMGQGCLDGNDEADAYQFTLEGQNNVDVTFMPDAGLRHSQRSCTMLMETQ